MAEQSSLSIRNTTENKQAKVSFLIPENLKLQYQELCKKRGGTISHYLRAYLIQDLLDNK